MGLRRAAIRLARRTAPLVALLPAAAAAQGAGYVGPGKCYTCHREKAQPMWEKVHKPSIAQLDKPQAAKFAAALGYGSDPRGARCIACHTTPAPGVPTGVSCESCHGPGRGYREAHQEAAFYSQADRKGMRDLFKKPDAIAKVCVDCHVTPDKSLADAGHPSGGDFDAGAALTKIAHWPSADQELSRPRDYDASFYKQVTEAARPLVKARAVAGGPAAAAAGPTADP